MSDQVEFGGWPAALEDAKRKHAEGRAYIARMRAAIRGIERMIATGQEWPGENPRKPTPPRKEEA